MSENDVTVEWDLPGEILEAILAILPVKSIATFTGVAKAWRDVIEQQPVLEKRLGVEKLWRSSPVASTGVYHIEDVYHPTSKAVALSRDMVAMNVDDMILAILHLDTMKYIIKISRRLEAMCFSHDNTFLFGISTFKCFGWHLNERANRVSRRVIFDSNQDENSLGVLTAVVSAGRHVVIGGTVGIIVSWKEGAWGASGQQLHGHTKCINTLASAGQGAFLVSSSLDATIRVWDVSQSKCLNVFDTTFTVAGKSICLLDHSEGILVYGGWEEENKVVLLGLKSGECVGAFEGQGGTVTDIVGHGSRVLTTSVDGMVKVWDVEEGKTCVYTLAMPHNATALAAWIDADRAMVLTTHGSVLLWTFPEVAT